MELTSATSMIMRHGRGFLVIRHALVCGVDGLAENLGKTVFENRISLDFSWPGLESCFSRVCEEWVRFTSELLVTYLGKEAV